MKYHLMVQQQFTKTILQRIMHGNTVIPAGYDVGDLKNMTVLDLIDT